MYIWQKKDWPTWHYHLDTLTETLSRVRYQQGILLGKMAHIGFDLRESAWMETLTQDVVHTSEIEGEILNPQQVRSSVARRLGINHGGLVPSSHHVDGVVEMMLDATQNYHLPLTSERLHSWHGALFPTGRSGLATIPTGAWRTDENGPMQVVSGYYGREKVHYEAPPASVVPSEMERFLTWHNSHGDQEPLIRAAIAHLWFVTIHPYADGNGRIARAIGDMSLAHSENTHQRFYSLSSQILIQRKEYYDILEATQKGSMDITSWIRWFLDCLEAAIATAEHTLQHILQRQKFWANNAHIPLNQRQQAMLQRLLEPDFKGKLTTSKWAKMTKCSQDTAHRDIRDLIDKGLLRKSDSGGRSTSYLCNF
ncbi:Fic family protein [Desulfurispira natronophila]|uniref:Fic family protein n=1 Tax=Desulfurispira natronophila TaxID=682562 RepID=A0A7W8DHJ0_9BACT|nr:Fic family protein [Desulfurispira natronophila]MBB5022338.1 Fic family protein [Desulfurispira natronophila]